VVVQRQAKAAVVTRDGFVPIRWVHWAAPGAHVFTPRDIASVLPNSHPWPVIAARAPPGRIWKQLMPVTPGYLMTPGTDPMACPR